MRVSTRSTRHRIMRVSICVVALLTTLLIAYAYLSQAGDGDRVRDVGATPGALETVSVMLSAYETLIQVITTAFGAVAFFLVYQRERGVTLRDDCWVYLYASLACLAGALLFGLGCYETLLVMLGRNAVDVSILALRFGRWIMYLALLGAVVFLGLFAIETTLPTQPEASVDDRKKV